MAPDLTGETPQGAEKTIRVLNEARSDFGSKIAWKAVWAIAQHARNANPEIAWIDLWPDHEGEAYFVRPLAHYAADGTDLALANPPAGAARVPREPGDRWQDEQALRLLTRQISPLCRELDETNSGTWQEVTTEPGDGEVIAISDDHGYRLHVNLVLGLDGPSGTRMVTRFLPDLDARIAPQAHPCAGTWTYEGLNIGSHEVFACTGGHRLIAPHPDGFHACTGACPATTIATPYPA